jgi:hypothetical protein
MTNGLSALFKYLSVHRARSRPSIAVTSADNGEGFLVTCIGKTLSRTGRAAGRRLAVQGWEGKIGTECVKTSINCALLRS